MPAIGLVVGVAWTLFGLIAPGTMPLALHKFPPMLFVAHAAEQLSLVVATLACCWVDLEGDGPMGFSILNYAAASCPPLCHGHSTVLLHSPATELHDNWELCLHCVRPNCTGTPCRRWHNYLLAQFVVSVARIVWGPVTL
jgi:hypothetical protein